MLETLRPDLLKMDPTAQIEFIRSYRERRTTEIEATKTARRAASSGMATKIVLSDEEKELMKKLGLSMTAIRSIRSEDNDPTSDEEEAEDTAELFDS